MIDFPITINKITIKASEIIPFIRKCESDKARDYLIEKTNCNEDEAREIIKELKGTLSNTRAIRNPKKDSDTFRICPECGNSSPFLTDCCPSCGYSTEARKIRIEKDKKRQENVHIPKCPTCGSTNIQRVRGSSLYYQRNFKCNHCGYKW